MSAKPAILLRSDFAYLEREEVSKGPPCPPAPNRDLPMRAGVQGFSSYGHRLASLYRPLTVIALTLTRGYRRQCFLRFFSS
ncbi:hypothetical protein IMCC21224_11872 [Puniceibacterium sp. IMCC21224]|nr:hypothetical protein IMCC21224_11872 [Puniceibacterium sp. IMCC21224]